MCWLGVGIGAEGEGGARTSLSQSRAGERSFHIFYQFLSDHKLCTELNLLGAAPADPPSDSLTALLSPRAARTSGGATTPMSTPRNQHPAMGFAYLRRAAHGVRGGARRGARGDVTRGVGHGVMAL